MLAVLAILTLAPLLYIPGFLISYALLGAAQPTDALERQYERVVAGALLHGWLALVLAELGLFSAGLHLALVLAVCVGCAGIAWRRGRLWLPAIMPLVSRSLLPGRKTKDEGRIWTRLFVLHPSSFVAHWETLSFAAVGMVFVLLVARPFEVVLGARDAGVYSNSGFAIAATGGIVQHDTLVQQIGQDQKSDDADLRAAAMQAETNLLGNQNAMRFIATRLRLSGFQIWAGDLDQGRVVPQFLHLYPAWIALLTGVLGLHGGLLATGLLGFLGVWSVGMLGRRLAGPWVGVLGALFLALNGVQVWFSRYSTSEACAQFLCFAALYGFAVMQGARRETRDRRQEMTESPTPQFPTPNSQVIFGGLIAGLAAGQLALARIDFFVLVLPLLLYLAYIAVTKRWSAPLWALTGGLGAMLLHALLHIVFISRAYFFDTLYARLQDQSAIIFYLTLPFLTPALRKQFMEIARSAPLRRPLRLPIELALLALLAIVFVLLRRDGRPQRWFEQLIMRYRRGLLRAGAALIVLLGIYGYLIRPQILTPQRLSAAPSCLAPTQLRAPSGDCLALQGYIGAPVKPPAHPNQVAYWLDSLSKLFRSQRVTSTGITVTVVDTTALFELPDNGVALAQVSADESLRLLGKTEDGKWYLVSNANGITGWMIASSLPIEASSDKSVTIQPANVVASIRNPRNATSFSVGNPSESEKIGIAQANLVRLGWYLSPLGVLLGVLGFALWWWRGLTRSSWLFLLVSLISAIFFLRLAYGTTDLTYIYILRRYMPVVYPAFSLGMAYAIVALAGRQETGDRRQETGDRSENLASRVSRLTSRVSRLASIALVLMLLGFFVVTNRPLYAHVEYQGALEQLAAIVGRYGFGANDVLLFRGEGRDTPDLVVTPLKYTYGLDGLAIRSNDPGKYAKQLAHYVQRWQAQGRQVYLVLGPNGAVELPGLRLERLGPFALHLPEFQQLRDQKPRGLQNFVFDFVVYRLAASTVATTPAAIAVDDFAAQVRGFYHPEQIGGQALAWTDGAALLRLPWPRDGEPHMLILNLSPGATRPASLGPAQACIAYRPESSFEFVDLPFRGEQCVTLNSTTMAGYRFIIDPRGQPAPATGTYLLRITSAAWVPAQADPAQVDQRALGVQFGGIVTGD